MHSHQAFIAMINYYILRIEEDIISKYLLSTVVSFIVSMATTFSNKAFQNSKYVFWMEVNSNLAKPNSHGPNWL